MQTLAGSADGCQHGRKHLMQQGIGCILQSASFSPTGASVELCGRSLAHQMPAFFRLVSLSTDTAQVLRSRRLLLQTSVSLAYASRLFQVSVKHRAMTIGIATATEIGSHRIHIRIHIRPVGKMLLALGRGWVGERQRFHIARKAARSSRTRISISVRVCGQRRSHKDINIGQFVGSSTRPDDPFASVGGP
jgi:hypothetical protein